jgi:hypothetical protein
MRSEYSHVAQDMGKHISRINAVMNFQAFLITRNFLAELTTLDSQGRLLLGVIWLLGLVSKISDVNGKLVHPFC